MDALSQLLYFFSEYVLHFDRYIPAIMAAYGSLIYFLLFLILFCETGLVITPFLPGDSLLFACGALSATADGLHFGYFFAICLTAAVLGDTCNYWIGEKFGLRILKSRNRLIKPEHVEKAQHFYEKHGHKAIFLCRFVPIVRTFAPFVAGIGTMHYRTFLHYNFLGGLAPLRQEQLRPRGPGHHHRVRPAPRGGSAAVPQGRELKGCPCRQVL